jgi:C1A family cysteine protease
MMSKQQSPIVDTSQDAAYNPLLAVTSKHVKINDPKLTWRPDKPDVRDYVFKAISIDGKSSIDLRHYCSPVENQGNLGSCTGHAVSSAMEVILKRENRLTEISRLFIYYQARLLEGTVRYDAGAYLRDCIKACNKIGAPAESLWKYDQRLYRNNPTAKAYTDASKRRVIKYERCADFTAVKNAIAGGNPVVAGFMVYSSFMTKSVSKTGMMPYPNIRSERSLGGHAVCLVGFDDATGRFIAKNSWGTGWGDKGYFYLTYDVIKNPQMSGDFWVISGITA